MSYSEFLASADEARFRDPYAPVAVGAPTAVDPLNEQIVAILGEVSERAKLSWLFDCVAHAAEILDREAKVAEGFIGLARCLLRGEYVPSQQLRTQIDKYQPVFEHAVARTNQNKTAKDAAMANVLYQLGTLLGYLYRAVAWFETDGGTWTQMVRSANGFPPLWQVLDGCAASRGGIAERQWQLAKLLEQRDE